MLTIRLCEEAMVAPILAGQIKCPCHLYSGEEAVAVGLCAHLTERDAVFSNHRSHGHYLAAGGKVRQMFSEVYGKTDGCARGRGGSMHLISPEDGMLGAAPIVAGTVSLAVGAALAYQIRAEDGVAVTFFGDGATTEGVVFEAMNFAALRRLPIVFVCENNYYATHMPIREIRPNVDIFKIAEPFGIHSVQVDGNDVLAVLDAAEQAIDRCRAGMGPAFIEAQTYRLRGHVGPDDNIQGTHTDIRPATEIAAWRQRDPLALFEQQLVADGVLTTEEIAAIRRDVSSIVDAAQQYAVAAEYPRAEELTNYVFK